ncbi:protein NO VEIN domain-containing protein [Pseudomonas aeruginosa]
MKRIAFIKTGWAPDYQGEEVVGRYGHIADYNEAHERFNMVKWQDGRYYGYIPPMGFSEAPPRPKQMDDWLLILIAARNGDGPLTVVGYYENASFEASYLPRPEYDTEDFPKDVHELDYTYCFSAPKAHLIPVADRNIVVSGKHIKQAPIVYVSGDGVAEDEWRVDLAALAEQIVSNRPPEEGEPKMVFPDQAHKVKVEKAAIALAMKVFDKAYKIKDRQKHNCGYDLLLIDKKTDEEIHLEVKGTASLDMRFFLTRNEYGYMQNPRWALFMVTDALGTPKGQLMRRKEVRKLFNLQELAWAATLKN